MSAKKKLTRIVRNFLLAAVLFALFYFFTGSPSMSPEQAYRRDAARNLVGPGEILGILNVDINGGYNRMLLAETDAGIIQYCYRYENLGFIQGNTFSSYEGDLIYREKQGGVSIMAATGLHYRYGPDSETLPLILFDEFPAAVRAEIELELTGETTYTTGNFDSDTYDFSYRLEAERKYGGLFVFELTTGGTDAENLAISRVSGLYAQGISGGARVPVTVRLYDHREQLVCEGVVHLEDDHDAALARVAQTP